MVCLINSRSKIDDYIHWLGLASSEDILSEISSIKASDDNLRALLKNTSESLLIMSLSNLIEKLDDYRDNSTKEFDSYSTVLDVLIHILNHTKPKNTLMTSIYDRILEIEKSTGEEITESTIFQLYDYLNGQKSPSKTHVNNVCEDTLIEYLSHNMSLKKEDISTYVKHAYDNRNLISKHMDEAIRNGGRTYTNMKIPLSIIYNIDMIDTLLENVNVLDFSINSCITVTTFTYLISKLKYVNKLMQGYDNPPLDEIFKSTIKNNIYMISLNRKSISTIKTLLPIKLNLLYTDALNLYDEYPYMASQLDKMDLSKSKSEIINEIVDTYNRTHFHTKMNMYFEESFKKKHGYNPLIYTLDYKEIFQNNRKFDIIISNVEQVDLTGKKNLKKFLRRYELYDNNQRYEYYYIEKALDIIGDNGIISLMISDEYKSSDDNKVRKLLRKHTILQMDSGKLIYMKNEPESQHKINDKIYQNTLDLNGWSNTGE